MTSSNLNWAMLLLAGLSLFACDSKPKVIESTPSENSSAIFNGNTTHEHAANADNHKVVAKETLDTERYTYVNVTEGENNYWIAIPQQKIEIGAAYYFRGGLLKKDFFSQEYNRVFETLYLVSQISKEPGESATGNVFSNPSTADTEPVSVEPAKGAIKISELLANPGKYSGKVVAVTGKCVKINPNIMNRNWVHLRDGSADNSDLTITTTELVQPGDVVTLEGTIALNKDFGAGYKYDVIMEGAVVKK